MQLHWNKKAVGRRNLFTEWYWKTKKQVCSPNEIGEEKLCLFWNCSVVVSIKDLIWINLFAMYLSEYNLEELNFL